LIALKRWPSTPAVEPTQRKLCLTISFSSLIENKIWMKPVCVTVRDTEGTLVFSLKLIFVVPSAQPQFSVVKTFWVQSDTSNTYIL